MNDIAFPHCLIVTPVDEARDTGGDLGLLLDEPITASLGTRVGSREFLTEQQRPCRPVGHLVLCLSRQALQEIPVVLVVFGDAVHAVIPQVEGRQHPRRMGNNAW
ncbi:MAG: hypothetical protein Q8M11_21350 [Sulfuritalea sp.]|nr:hypothetical protein [Sulfuritalea sp.]MDP1983593.1 hypothetical protein [Sulfuritalea sp.]